MSWSVGNRVEVRADKGHAWKAGTVRYVPEDEHASCPQGCYAVELDTPVTADAWSGTTRRYGGTELVGGPGQLVFVYSHSDLVATGDHIRSEGG